MTRLIRAKHSSGAWDTEVNIGDGEWWLTTATETVTIHPTNPGPVLILNGLPTSDPGVPGALYRTGAAVKVSL